MIDIIVPVYNTPIKDLNRCLESIRKQKYTNWMCYIIDDGSKEQIKEWLDNYSKEDNRFIIKHINNKGVSNARNYGIEISKNEYLTFCDSDDTFSDIFLEEAYNLIKSRNADLVIGSILLINKKKNIELKSFKNIEFANIGRLLDSMLAGVPLKADKDLNNILLGRPMPKIYKREIIKKIKFDSELKLHEDNLFSVDYILNCQKVVISNSIWYNYYQNDYSSTHKLFSKDNLNQEIKFINKLIEREEKLKNINALNGLKMRLANIYILYFQMLSNVEDFKKIVKNTINTEVFKKIEGINYKNYINLKKEKIVMYKIFSLKSNFIKYILISLFIKTYKIKIRSKK